MLHLSNCKMVLDSICLQHPWHSGKEQSITYSQKILGYNCQTLLYFHNLTFWQTIRTFNPSQSNFSANRILPSSYLFGWEKQPREYNRQLPVHIKTLGLPRNRMSATCAICWPKSVLHEEKCRTGFDSGVGRNKNVSDVF